MYTKHVMNVMWDAFASTLLFLYTGTTWVQHIVCLILEDGTTSNLQDHLFLKAPFLEMPQSFSKETVRHL